MATVFEGFLDRFTEATSKRAKTVEVEATVEVVPLVLSFPPRPVQVSAPSSPACSALPAVPQSCCAASSGDIRCAACGVKSYCSLRCQVRDMLAHRSECEGATAMQHVYAFCGTMPEEERVAFLKTLPKNAAAGKKKAGGGAAARGAGAAAAAPKSVSFAAALNKAEVVTCLEAVLELPECFYFRDLPSRAVFPNYYTVIAEPVSLKQMMATAKRGRYANQDAVMRDLHLMAENAARFNGSSSHVAREARFIADEVGKRLRAKKCPHLQPGKQRTVVTCGGCGARRCEQCGPCSCAKSDLLKLLMSAMHLAQSSKDDTANLSPLDLKTKIESLSVDHTGVLAQMLAEEMPHLFDTSQEPQEISLELTDDLCERIKYIFV